LIATVLDAYSFVAWKLPVERIEASGEYAAELEAARTKTGLEESIIAGEGRVGGHRVAVVVGEFGFLGGSIGVAAATLITAAVRRATAEKLPLLAAPVSGGTRMQEGTVAFVQMVTISAAVSDHRRAGLPYLVYLRHPTTGGVFASWGSLGHVTVAEPGALIGFLGPRVYTAIHGDEFPPNVQTAENLFAHGLVDAVLTPNHLSTLAASVIEAWSSRSSSSEYAELAGRAARSAIAHESSTAPDTDDWNVVCQSRVHNRPGLRSVLMNASLRPVPLSGTGQGESDPTLTLAITRFGGRGVVVLGQDRRSQTGDVALGPEALRVAGRGIRLAEELNLPLVTVIDTPGAALSKAAEEGGLAGEIGRCLVALLDTHVPTVSVILGQGTGGAALALLPADHILVAENGWLSPLPPEGASAIVHRDPSRAPELARQQRIGAGHLLADGIVDEIVPEGAGLGVAMAEAITRALDSLAERDPDDRVAARRSRFASLTPHFTTTVERTS
tara:strand:+ start:6298 stop:7800 length:1503 start_codon:yes stop_codon:yes gene_type:complete